MSDRMSYYQKISLSNKTPEQAKIIMDIFEKNKNIAYKIASKYYKTKYWEFDEALQIALMGLWKACLIWDKDKFRLSTLAYNIINRDFIDFDTKQKRQPDILFNLEDNCVTDDLNLEDVLLDDSADVEDIFVQDDTLKELNQDILYILEDISDDLNINRSIVKLVYITYIECNKDKQLNMRSLSFIKKQTIKQIIDELQIRLKNIL